jgi:beta-lactamase regulating signal transducer with metallopeptidase domain
MSDFVDLRLEPVLWLLADWSLRWGVLIVALGVWFAARPPRQAALRLAVCQLVLVAGLALPLVPHWWGHELIPARWVTPTDDFASEGQIPESLDPSTVDPTTAAIAPPPRLDARANQGRADYPATATPSSVIAHTVEPLGVRRIVVLIAMALWSIGTCVQLIRLIAGANWLSRLPRSAAQPGLRAQELFDRCREEIGLRRSVRLGMHPALAAPVFVGGWRSWVLVPTDWEQLAAEDQRAVLWHELAHVARRDDLAKLVEETVRAVFFFHPCVRWLLNRVDAYREQSCDVAAVRRGVAGRRLAQILVEFSRRSPAPAHRDRAMRPALPFFRRRTVKDRIHELLEENTVARWSAPLVRSQFVGLAVIAVSTGIAFGGFGPRATGSQDAPAQLAALDQEKAPATTTGATVPTLERILANWKAREQRTRTLYLAWERRTFVGEAAELRSQGKAFSKRAEEERSRVSQFSFWAEEPDRCRLDSTPVANPQPAGATFAVKSHSVINGATALSVDEPGNATDSPVCRVAGGGHWRRLASTPIVLTIRPPDALLLGRRSQFRVVTENTLIAGLRCVELRNADDNDRWIERCWVDSARDDVVVAYELQLHPKDEDRPKDVRTISIQYRRDLVHGWVPAGWTSQQPGELSEDRITKYAINEPIAAEIFSLKLAPGTLVFDERTREQYRIAKDGSKSDVVKVGSPPSLRILEALASKSDFRIQPQSLKDAIDFISARYQIPIVLNLREFAKAGIDVTSEVQFPREGIAVADLLKNLLGQCRRPAGFRIEDEVLKISPKIVSQAPIHIKPAPVAPKTESPAARRIREALEQAVDFNIESQDLKDALDFVAARYQIKVVIDRAVVAKTEVKGAFPGIKLRSLLSILLEELPKPVGFKIEDDVLKIYSVADKPASGAARP